MKKYISWVKNNKKFKYSLFKYVILNQNPAGYPDLPDSGYPVFQEAEFRTPKYPVFSHIRPDLNRSFNPDCIQAEEMFSDN